MLRLFIHHALFMMPRVAEAREHLYTLHSHSCFVSREHVQLTKKGRIAGVNSFCLAQQSFVRQTIIKYYYSLRTNITRTFLTFINCLNRRLSSNIHWFLPAWVWDIHTSNLCTFHPRPFLCHWSFSLGFGRIRYQASNCGIEARNLIWK
jgi:hypothetical protein